MYVKINVESKLISRLKGGEEAAFRAIYDQLHKHIFRLLYSLVKDQEQTEDLLQETFVCLWTNRGKLEETQSLYPYVYLIAKRLALDHFRQKMADVRSKVYFRQHQDENSNYTEESINAADLDRFTKLAIETLPKQQRLIFILNKNEGLSYDEIGERLHISRNTVKNHLVCAVKAMKIYFMKNYIIFFFFFFLQ